ncbi:MAG: long-chain fatty acid--CoA ligase [Anaerolineae bacterium]|nr:long-chain fatty acid--CoA ligase [Anaerolineae bacterium]
MQVAHRLQSAAPADQLIFIINHAEDKVIFVDDTLIKLLEPLAPQLKTVKHYIVMTHGELPETSLPNVHSYEELLAAESGDYGWPEIDENAAAAMCYTSGTTGHPKGVLYSHRAIYLHTMMVSLTDAMGLAEPDILMPVVPMFHAMAWGLVYAGTMVGCTLIYPGPHMQGADLAGLIQDEKITVTAGVPTLWLGLLQVLEAGDYNISSLQRMPVGGSAAPRSMIKAYKEKFGVDILHAWGMTEMTPVGTLSAIKSHMADWSDEAKLDLRAKQGITPPGVEMRIMDVNGEELPWDGEAMGELQVRGPAVTADYYKDERSADSFTEDGWFRTGDVSSIDSEGYMQIVDRTKDLVKSGGEWISTVELENAIMGHEDVMEAAVIAIPHPKWQERPLACVVVSDGADKAQVKAGIYDLLSKEFAKWQLPDDIEFIAEVPKTSVGKFDKKVLRKQYEGYQIAETE